MGTTATIDKAPVTTTASATDYAIVADDLISLYTGIEKAAWSLPAASATPFLVFLWTFIKFEFAFLGDILLIVPINIFIFIRNMLPGRWSYRCFCCRYFKITVRWLWIGETIPPAFIFRPLVVSLLHWHFRSRLSALRRQILLDTGFSEERGKGAIDRIDRALGVWEHKNTVKSVLFTWILPLLGPATSIWNWLVPISFMPSPTWTRFTAVISVSYVLTTLSAAFAVKRGLMLGEKGGAAFYPGFILGPGGYERERNTLSIVGVQLSEFPLDLALLVGSLALAVLTGNVLDEFMRAHGLREPDWENQYFFDLYFYPVYGVVFVVLPWLRRRKLNRL